MITETIINCLCTCNAWVEKINWLREKTLCVFFLCVCVCVCVCVCLCVCIYMCMCVFRHKGQGGWSSGDLGQPRAARSLHQKTAGCSWSPHHWEQETQEVSQHCVRKGSVLHRERRSERETERERDLCAHVFVWDIAHFLAKFVIGWFLKYLYKPVGKILVYKWPFHSSPYPPFFMNAALT